MGPFERKVLIHYSFFGPLWKQRIYKLQLLLGPLWKQSSLLIHYSCCWAPLFESKVLFTLQLQRGLRGKCLACLPLNTPLHIILTMILYENMKPIEHVLLHPICVLSHLMCACKHCNVAIFTEHIEVADVLITSKNTNFTRFFVSKPRHLGRLKNRSGWKKPQWEPWSHAENARYGKLQWAFEDLLPRYCYAKKTKSTTVR